MVSKTITSTKTTKKAIDFRANLSASGTEHFAALHGQGGKNGRKSTIKAVLCDYSNGTGKGNSHTVDANLSVDTMAKLYEVAKQAILPRNSNTNSLTADASVATMLAQAKDAASALYKELNGKETVDKAAALAGVARVGKMIAAVQAGVKPAADYGPEYKYSQTRVNTYAIDKATGIAPVSLLSVQRQPLRSNGEVARNPWVIKVTNGKAKSITTETGSVNYDRNSFQKEDEVSVMLSDDDMFRMMDACHRYITVWENSLISQVLDGLTQLEAEYAAARDQQ